MDIKKEIFRAYDVRGIYGKDLNEDIMERIGNAFASEFVDDTMVMGSDGRTTGPSLKKAFIEGVTKAGKNVIDAGVVPRGVCLFAAWKKGVSSAYITASHLGKEWNGVKFAGGDGNELHEKDNYRVRDIVLSGKFAEVGEKGSVEELNPTKDYIDYMLSKIPKAGDKLKVMIDCGNGTGGLAAPELFRKCGFDTSTLFEDVDGNFPNRPSEINEVTLGKLREKVSGADIGIAYDGDSDRMSLMDEKGRLLGPETTSYLILRELTKNEKGPIIANVECLKIMDEIAKKYGRDLHRVRVGNSFMVSEVYEKKACFGVERSGHFCIPSIIPVDDGIAASLYAVSALAMSGKRLSEIVDELPQYPFKRFKVDCADNKKFGVVESLKEKLSGKYERVNTIDGVRIDFDHGWILIRVSNTEPIIRLSVEADNKEKLEELASEFQKILEEEVKSS